MTRAGTAHVERHPGTAHGTPARKGRTLCDGCGAKCCRYIALEIDRPDCRDDFEDLRWYLCHQNTVIYVDDDTWYLHFDSDCRYRGTDDRCRIYEKRPTMCREHSPEDCERDEPWGYDLKFTCLEELEVYLSARYG